MKGINKKKGIIIVVSLILSVITLFSIYGFGWGIGAEQSLMIGLSGLPVNQLWKVNGAFSLEAQQLDNPIVINYNGQVRLSMESSEMDSQWEVDGNLFGNFNFLNLAFSAGKLFLEFPALSEETVWQIGVGENALSAEDLLAWIKELTFQKEGYVTLEREIGGNVSCLCLRSSNNPLPAKAIEWLSKVADADLPADKKQELQQVVEDNLVLTVNLYLSPEMEIMEVEALIAMKDNLSIELILRGRPKPAPKPDLTHYQQKRITTLDPRVIESWIESLGIGQDEVGE